jgi:hypothetical protein
MCGYASAQEAAPTTSTFIFDTSQSVRFWWTETAYFDDRPKAWDGIASPEISASLRALSGPFEAKVEIGAIADRFNHFQDFDADSLRAAVQFGWNPGDWSYVVEWEGFDVFEPGIGDFYVGFNTYDINVSRCFALNMIERLPAGLFQASLTAGYVASTFDPLERRFAEFELEWVQPCSGGMTMSLAPKVEFSDYPHFSVAKRQDAIFSLTLAPTFNVAEGLTLTLEGQGSFAFSTLGSKSGEAWAITPTLRFQSGL